MIVGNFIGGTFFFFCKLLQNQKLCKKSLAGRFSKKRREEGDGPRISHAGSAMRAPELSAAFFKSPACKNAPFAPPAMATNSNFQPS